MKRGNGLDSIEGNGMHFAKLSRREVAETIGAEVRSHQLHHLQPHEAQKDLHLVVLLERGSEETPFLR